MAFLLNFDKNISYFTVKKYMPTPTRIYPSSNAIQLRGRLLRAEAASSNGFEALPLFAAAVTAGNAAGLSALTMNTLSRSWHPDKRRFDSKYGRLGQRYA
ncbi:hypothetical protein N0V91_005325 [Didymella pomorum]|uniref:Uncharacterized protein n=1 Tax=Didymella pomorum TaxID=749634 RepID=A0A9W9D8J9_9PLEO|nr:hypothetical protein N0V91_005325 [Didymella pomorum]